MFDFESLTWLLPHTKLSEEATLFCKKLDFYSLFCFEGLSMQIFSFGFKFIFCSCLFASLLFFKKCFWEKLLIFFWTFGNLVTFLYSYATFNFICIYRHDYSFSSGKKWLFIERFFLFLMRCVQSKNEQLLRLIFS